MPCYASCKSTQHTGMLLLLEQSDLAAVRINHDRLIVDFENSHPSKEKRLVDLTTGCNKCVDVRLWGIQKSRGTLVAV